MNSRAFILLAALAALIFGLASCGRQDKSGPAGPRKAEEGGKAIELRVYPDPPVALRETELMAHLSDDGKPLKGAKVSFDLTMPAMYHGENRPVAAEVDTGIYTAKAVMPMAGVWLIDVRVEQGGQKFFQKFYVDVKEK